MATSKEYFDIITEKIDEFGYSDVNIENCCTPEQIDLLAETITPLHIQNAHKVGGNE